MQAPTKPQVVCLLLGSGRGVRMGGPKAVLDWPEHRCLADAHVRLRAGDCDRVVLVVRASVAARLRPMLPDAWVIASAAPGPLGPAGSIAAAVRAGALAQAAWALITPVDVVPTKTETIAKMLAMTTDSASPGVRGIEKLQAGMKGSSRPQVGGVRVQGGDIGKLRVGSGMARGIRTAMGGGPSLGGVRVGDGSGPATARAVKPRYDGKGGHPVMVRADVLVDAYLAAAPPPLRDVLRKMGEACVSVNVDDADILVDLDTPESYEARTGCRPW